MKSLWLAFLAIATFGSFYPFDFGLSGPLDGALRALLDSARARPSRGDVVGNFVLFLPIGLTGVLAAGARSRRAARYARVFSVSVAFALALQLGQLYLPSRDASLLDVVWNAAGVVAGAALAAVVSRGQAPAAAGLGGAALVPLGLIAGWLAYRLLPFVPSIDFQLFKDSLKPLFYGPLDPASALRDAVGWILMGYLLRRTWPAAPKDRYLPLLMLFVFGLEVLIVNNAIDRADVAGAAAALLLWFGLLGRLRRPEGLVIALLAGTIAVGGLAPFVLRVEAAPFHWLPFRGFLGGSMYLNAQSALEKTFLYGSLVFVIQQATPRRRVGVGAACVFVGLVEFAQTLVVGHSPEITDPLLVLLASLALVALERQDIARTPVQPPGEPRTG